MAKKGQDKAPAKRGRPSKFTPEIADEICERLANGEPLAKICRDEHMPTRVAVHDWAKADGEFLYASHARERIGTTQLRTGRGIQRAVTQLKATVRVTFSATN